MSAAIDLRHQLHARVLAPDIQPSTLGAVELVRREGRQVNVVLDNIEWDLADCLHRIGVKQHAALMAESADFRIGCNAPISLFAVMMVTRMVLSSMARFRSSRSMRPSFCTGR